ncbi:hypothetical protein VCUG_02849 [Vavraia culicis subsp. floridensis]|uniref:Uncharacterized protein n=1 Tax=Vavraia culicis (isolate floridensis) TaxID=948595 RepID=A0A024RE39_VAVCU|nr:uncharacterized protein VCUG_02849 [Vavraia culicis subsp. floridensis]ETA55731.1 hypothetical protein VCUG_02849 [Vavraia culicis subsp. floridensis]
MQYHDLFHIPQGIKNCNLVLYSTVHVVEDQLYATNGLCVQFLVIVALANPKHDNLLRCKLHLFSTARFIHSSIISST